MNGSKISAVIAHLNMLFIPALTGLATSALWYAVLFKNNIHLPRADEAALTNMLIPVLAVFHALLASTALKKVWEEFKQVRACIRKNDEATFKDCIQDRIPGLIHLFLATLSVLLLSSVALVEYSSPWSGAVVIFAITFVLTLFWLVATTLDTPSRSPLLRYVIPEEWNKHCGC